MRRLRRHRHGSRFVIAQVLYLTGVVGDGTAARAAHEAFSRAYPLSSTRRQRTPLVRLEPSDQLAPFRVGSSWTAAPTAEGSTAAWYVSLSFAVSFSLAYLHAPAPVSVLASGRRCGDSVQPEPRHTTTRAEALRMQRRMSWEVEATGR